MDLEKKNRTKAKYRHCCEQPLVRHVAEEAPPGQGPLRAIQASLSLASHPRFLTNGLYCHSKRPRGDRTCPNDRQRPLSTVPKKIDDRESGPALPFGELLT